MDWKEFLRMNAGDILLAAALAAGLFVFCRSRLRKKVFEAAYRLVCLAEREYAGTGRGREKKAAVLAALHAALPAWVRAFVSEEDLDALVEGAVSAMKQALKAAAEQKSGEEGNSDAVQ